MERLHVSLHAGAQDGVKGRLIGAIVAKTKQAGEGG